MKYYYVELKMRGTNIYGDEYEHVYNFCMAGTSPRGKITKGKCFKTYEGALKRFNLINEFNAELDVPFKIGSSNGYGVYTIKEVEL